MSLLEHQRMIDAQSKIISGIPMSQWIENILNSSKPMSTWAKMNKDIEEGYMDSACYRAIQECIGNHIMEYCDGNGQMIGRIFEILDYMRTKIDCIPHVADQFQRGGLERMQQDIKNMPDVEKEITQMCQELDLYGVKQYGVIPEWFKERNKQ